MSIDPVSPIPFPLPPLPSSGFCFGVLLYYFFSLFLCFLGFFVVSIDLLNASFAALRPLLGFFRAPTAMSFHHALLCTGSTYTRSVSFHVFLFACIQFCCFFFSLYFVCYLLVIMLWPRWFNWIPFDADLCVVDMYVTLAFESMRKNGSDLCVVNECISWLNCRGG
jgi:hypothetical protein